MIQLSAGDHQHSTNIAQMLFRACFTKEFQLSNNHVLRRRNRNRGRAKGIAFGIAKGPRVQFISSGEIEIPFQRGAYVHQIEMSLSLTHDFLENRCVWWNVERRTGKNLTEARHIACPQKDYKINVMGDPRLAIKRGSDAAADEVSDPSLFQRPREQFDQIRFGHGRKYQALLLRRALPASRDAGCGGRPSCAGASSSKGDWQPATVLPGSSDGAPRFVRGLAARPVACVQCNQYQASDKGIAAPPMNHLSDSSAVPEREGIDSGEGVASIYSARK